MHSLFGRIRQADQEEVLASTGRTAEVALADAYSRSTRCWAVSHKGKAFFVFGVCGISLSGDRGYVWALGSDDVKTHGLAICRNCAMFIAEMLKLYPVLENWVDARNTVAIRWLRSMGFAVEPPTPHGVSGKLFHHFSLCATSRQESS